MKVNGSVFSKWFSLSLLSILTFVLAQPRAFATCTISATLVNSCGPWLGAAAADYNGAPIVSPDTDETGVKTQILYHETRVGRKMSIVHTYHQVGVVTFTADEIYFVNRANTYLLVNWKPADPWIDGSNGTNDSQINAMAESVHDLPGKIFLSLYHEPENNVSVNSDGLNCTLHSGATSGSYADYRNMWSHVRTLFNNHKNTDGTTGVTNVVWVMIYQGIAMYDPCMTNALWPGNSRVDWVAWDPYVNIAGPPDNQTWDSSVSYFYNWMENNSNDTYSYKGRPWMLAEFGINGESSQQDAYAYYDSTTSSSIKKSLDANTYPNVKAYIVFDELGASDTQVEWGGVPPNQFYDATEQTHYNNFALDPKMQ